VFGDGDHRSRKRWFTPAASAIINEGLAQLRRLPEDGPSGLLQLALWSCLARSGNAVVLAGFTGPAQVRANIAAVGECPDGLVLARARTVMAAVQEQLDSAGEVFLDERP
jgi:methylglyoxal reductase